MYLPDDDAGALMPFGDLHNHRSPPGVAPDLGEGCPLPWEHRVNISFVEPHG